MEKLVRKGVVEPCGAHTAIVSRAVEALMENLLFVHDGKLYPRDLAVGYRDQEREEESEGDEEWMEWDENERLDELDETLDASEPGDPTSPSYNEESEGAEESE
jgi:hypothetical protein